MVSFAQCRGSPRALATGSPIVNSLCLFMMLVTQLIVVGSGQQMMMPMAPPQPPPPPPPPPPQMTAMARMAPPIAPHNPSINPMANGGLGDEVCGLSMNEFRHNVRIVGGRSAIFAEVPFVCHLRESHLFRVLGYNKCGCVLINHRWVLTAAHCKPAFFSSLEVILGKHKTFEDAPPPEGSAMASLVKAAGKSFFSSGAEDLDDSTDPESNDVGVDDNFPKTSGKKFGRKHPVLQVLAETVIVHPDYEAKTLECDLALIKLKKSVPFRDDIQPICLPSFNEDFTGFDGYATGWGLTDFDKRQLPDTLQIVRLPVISNKRCQSMYKKAGHDKKITEMDLCAGYAKGGMDACEGDSGGPLIVRRHNDQRWVLGGVVSNGVKCGEPLLPGVYTRVSKFVPWIMEQMKIHS